MQIASTTAKSSLSQNTFNASNKVYLTLSITNCWSVKEFKLFFILLATVFISIELI